ncbi:MAG: hypothetical protein AAFV80_20430, partial [Bacteroidota bacterium]
NFIRAKKVMAESCDALISVNTELLPFTISEYGSLSWWALFTKDYKLSESSAHRCLELDQSQIYVYTNLGHSQILRGQFKKGLKSYNHLKGKNDESGKAYKIIILEDLDALEAENITHPDFEKVRAELEKW